MLFGRMNPPTKGHEENVEGAKRLAQKQGAEHLVVASHSVDAKKNPLTPDVKLKHLKRSFPNTNIITSSKEKPTIMHHASDAFNRGIQHLTVVAGADRVDEYKRLLNHYNGKFSDEAGNPLRHGGYNFKSIKVLSTGERKQGISGTDMRNHAQNNDFKSFQSNLSSSMQANPQHAKELFRDVRKGMGLNENHNRGLFKAIFVTGGPGSGKDVVIREAIAEQKAVEITSTLAYNYLMDKGNLAEHSSDFRREAIRNRGPLIINGPADDHSRIFTIKEELEELGYSTTMVFVDTTNEASQSRNEKLTKMIAESVRQEKWEQAQACKESYRQNFSNFINLNNSGSLETIEEDITDIYHKLNRFIDNKTYMEEAYRWMETHGKLNSNDSITVLVKENNNVEKNFSFVQRLKESRNPKLTRGTSGRAENLGSIVPDNLKIGTTKDQVKDGSTPKGKNFAAAGHSGGAWSGVYEENKPNIKKFAEPKESNFQQDADKIRRLRRGDKSIGIQQFNKPSGVGQEYDTRAGGQSAAAGAGLGNQTYSEDTVGPTASNADVVNFAAIAGGPKPNPLETGNKQFKKFRTNIKEWNGFQNEPESGFGGTLGGSDNKEPMENPKDKVGYNYTTTKKRKNGVKK